jgi:hypothetical protein
VARLGRQFRPWATGDSFECATLVNSDKGWAVNHQGQVFTESGGTSWTKVSELKDFGAAQIEFLNENSLAARPPTTTKPVRMHTPLLALGAVLLGLRPPTRQD